MESCTTDIDWDAQPEPWRWIGPQFRRECEDIISRFDGATSRRLVRDRRKSMGLSQDKVAEAVGCKQNNLSLFERTGTGLSSERVQRLCRFLGIDDGL